MDENLGPLGYINSIHTSNMAKMPNRKLVLRNRKLGRISETNMAKMPNIKLVLRNRKLGCILATVSRRVKRTNIWALWAQYTVYICPIWLKMPNRKLVSPNRKLSHILVTVHCRAKWKFGPSWLYKQHTYLEYGKKAEQEVGWAKQKFGSYLRNGAS